MHIHVFVYVCVQTKFVEEHWQIPKKQQNESFWNIYNKKWRIASTLGNATTNYNYQL